MPDSDFSELDDLFRDLTEVPDLVNRKVQQSVQQTAMRTKREWQDDAKVGSRRAVQYAASIDYEVRDFGAFGEGQYVAEIGPDLARYGGKTGKGGLIPSMGILDDPQSTSGIRGRPSHARQRAERFADDELTKGIEIAVEQSHKEKNL